MGLFERLFGPSKTDQAIRGYFQTLTAYNPVFYSRSGGIYEAAETRAAIHTFATHCSKLKPNVKGPQRGQLERKLQFAMSPWQRTSQFLYRAATIFDVENTCFLVPVLNERGRTVGAFPVLPSRCEIVEGTDKKLYLRYEFQTGKHAAVEYDRCGVLVQHQYKDDFFGESNAALDAYFTKYRINPADREYDVIFVNGDSNLENLRTPNESWKVQMTELEFKKRMFEEG